MIKNIDIVSLLPSVIDAINIVGERFNHSKGLIITESDMKCQIYSELRCLISESSETYNLDILGSPLHTEVAFYNPNDSNYADMPVDIALLDPSMFSIIKDPKFRLEYGKITNGLPNKQYRTLGNTILIELKFNKNKGGITKSFTNSILRDIAKLETIIGHNSNCVMKGVSVTFNKTDKFCREFEENVLNTSRENIDIIYKSSNIGL